MLPFAHLTWAGNSSIFCTNALYNCRSGPVGIFLLLLGLKTLKVATGKCDSHILKISPGAYIFQRPFLTGLFLEGLIFGGAHLWREICVSKSIGQAFYLEVN